MSIPQMKAGYSLALASMETSRPINKANGASQFSRVFRQSLSLMESQSQWSMQMLDYILLQRLVEAVGITFSREQNGAKQLNTMVNTISWLQSRSFASPRSEPHQVNPSNGSGQLQSTAIISNGNEHERIKGDVPFKDEIAQAAEKYGLSPSLIQAVIKAESNFDPNAVSPVGAQGLMQLMPATASELGVKDPFDPSQNIDAGSRYLKGLLHRYHGDIRLALAAYNWGMGNLERQPEKMPEETKNYVTKVIGFMNREIV